MVSSVTDTPTPSVDELAEHVDALYRFALGLVRDPDLAADLVQDTFVRAVDRRAQFRGEGSVLSWLRQSLHNLAIDRARRSAHEVVVDDVDRCWRSDEYTVDPSVVAERIADREQLEDALVRLPFDHRTVVMLHDVEQWRLREIAELQQISLPAAKQRLRRGRMMLVTALAGGAERREQLRGVPMRCWEARRQVSDYLDGALDTATATVLETHLSACPTCPPLYAELVDAQEHLADLRDPDSVIPPDLKQRLRRTPADQPGG